MDNMTYFEPDKIWNNLGINSQEDYIDKYMVKGRFHSLVPEKIVYEYKIVERLLFYSYFCYPLIDEAFSKSTRIFEASVTLRLQKEGLIKKGFESLSSKLKRLKEHCSIDLFEQWEKARLLRNEFAHMEAGRTKGFFLLGSFIHNLNMINTIFLEEKAILERESLISDLKHKSKHLRKGLFILDYQDKRILIFSAHPYSIGTMNCTGQSLWVFRPVSGEKNINKANDLPNSFILRLEKVEITNDGLSAIESVSKNAISLISTDKPENVNKLIDHNNRILLSPSISEKYIANLKNLLFKEIGNLLYDDWD